MNKYFISLDKLCGYRRTIISLSMLGVLTFSSQANAQYFSAGNGDMVAGFRKTGANLGSYELVVKLGSVTDLLALAPGTTIPMGNFTPGQLSAAFSDYNNLQWSVSGMVTGGPGYYWSGFYQSTIWFTLPRAVANTQTTPLARQSVTTQGTTKGKISGFINGAQTLSSSQGSTNVNNTSVLVRETIATAHSYDYAFFVENSPQNPVLGDFSGTMPTSVENITPASFNAPVISDLYQSVPQLYSDPTTGTNNGLAYWVGFFTLKPDGTMTFTRASAVVAPPPVPMITSISRTNTTSYISFTTTNGSFTYSLYYTNAAGLTAPVTNWPHSATVTGDGTIKTLNDTSADAIRFYSIGVQ